MIAPFDLGGPIGWASILTALCVAVVAARATWLRRAARPALATADEAAAYWRGVAAVADRATVSRSRQEPKRLRRWWRQGYRGASRFHAEAAEALLEMFSGPRA